MDMRIDEYLKTYNRKEETHITDNTSRKYIPRNDKQKKKTWEKRKRVSKYRKKCKLCGASIDSSSAVPVCKNCQISLFQLEELKRALIDYIKRGDTPPDWALKAAKKITEILSNYPEFRAYKNVVSDIVWTYIIDDDAQNEGIEIEELVSLKYTYKSKKEILQELYELEIVDITNDRRVFPGRFLMPLLEIKKVYGDNFSSVNWELYTSAIQAVFMLDVAEKQINEYLNGGKKKNPKQVLALFKILSRVIEDNVDKSEYPQRFSLPQFDFDLMLSFLGDKKSRLRFYVNIAGIVDGKSKLIDDFDEKSREFEIHKDFNDYIVHMIERLREIERDRE